jgi:hypothetical protein
VNRKTAHQADADHRFAGNATTAQSHAKFLALIPTVEKHVQIAFRGRPEVDREKAAAEAVARAFVYDTSLVHDD